MTDRPFSEIDPNEPGMSGVPFDQLAWPPDLDNGGQLLIGAVLGEDPLYLGAKLEILLAMMRDWHSRFNALVAFLEQRDKEILEKLQVLEDRLNGDS